MKRSSNLFLLLFVSFFIAGALYLFLVCSEGNKVEEDNEPVPAESRELNEKPYTRKHAIKDIEPASNDRKGGIDRESYQSDFSNLAFTGYVVDRSNDRGIEHAEIRIGNNEYQIDDIIYSGKNGEFNNDIPVRKNTSFHVYVSVEAEGYDGFASKACSDSFHDNEYYVYLNKLKEARIRIVDEHDIPIEDADLYIYYSFDPSFGLLKKSDEEGYIVLNESEFNWKTVNYIYLDMIVKRRGFTTCLIKHVLYRSFDWPDPIRLNREKSKICRVLDKEHGFFVANARIRLYLYPAGITSTDLSKYAYETRSDENGEFVLPLIEARRHEERKNSLNHSCVHIIAKGYHRFWKSFLTCPDEFELTNEATNCIKMMAINDTSKNAISNTKIYRLGTKNTGDYFGLTDSNGVFSVERKCAHQTSAEVSLGLYAEFNGKELYCVDRIDFSKIPDHRPYMLSFKECLIDKVIVEIKDYWGNPIDDALVKVNTSVYLKKIKLMYGLSPHKIDNNGLYYINVFLFQPMKIPVKINHKMSCGDNDVVIDMINPNENKENVIIDYLDKSIKLIKTISIGSRIQNIRVIDESGNPVCAVNLVVRYDNTNDEEKKLHVMTDNEGFCGITVSDFKSGTISVFDRPDLTKRITREMIYDKELIELIYRNAPLEEHSISGYFHNENMKPLPGIVVYLSGIEEDSDIKTRRTFNTNNEGYFVFSAKKYCSYDISSMPLIKIGEYWYGSSTRKNVFPGEQLEITLEKNYGVQLNIPLMNKKSSLCDGVDGVWIEGIDGRVIKTDCITNKGSRIFIYLKNMNNELIRAGVRGRNKSIVYSEYFTLDQVKSKLIVMK